MKKCAKCKEEKIKNDFYVGNHICKICQSIYNKERRKKMFARLKFKPEFRKTLKADDYGLFW